MRSAQGTEPELQGYVYLQVSDEGGELGLQSTLPWIEWEILRIR